MSQRNSPSRNWRRGQRVALPVLLSLSACTGQITLPGSDNNPGSSDDPSDAHDVSPEDLPDLPPATDPETGLPLEFQLSVAPLRRLNRIEYRNAVDDLLGIKDSPASTWSRETHESGFDNEVSGQIPSGNQVDQFMLAAEDAASKAVQRLSTLLPCTPTGASDTVCALRFVDQWAVRAYRRPLTPEDRERLLGIFRVGSEQGSFATGIQLVIQTVLQSPHFFYRVEIGVPDADGRLRLNGWEMASRLSFFIQETTPDAVLLKAAADDALRTPVQIAEQVRRLIKTDRGRATLRRFHQQWLETDALASAVKDPAVFGNQFSSAVKQGLVQGLDAFIEHVFTGAERPDVRTLFTSTAVFVNQHTAPLYDLAGITGDALQKVEITAQPRAGLLTNAGLMSLLAGGAVTKPISRGVWLREKILCQPLPSPPNDIEIPEPPEGLLQDMSMREWVTNTTAPSQCRACHSGINPTGFLFENYDAIGRYRTTDGKFPIDSGGGINGTLNADADLDGAVALAEHLVDNVDVHTCIVNQWYSYAFGRIAGSDDDSNLTLFLHALKESSFNLEDLLVAIAISDPFRFVVAGSNENQGACL